MQEERYCDGDGVASEAHVYRKLAPRIDYPDRDHLMCCLTILVIYSEQHSLPFRFSSVYHLSRLHVFTRAHMAVRTYREMPNEYLWQNQETSLCFNDT